MSAAGEKGAQLETGISARELVLRHRELLERLPCVAYLAAYGALGRWFYVSPRVEDLIGFTAEEMVADPEVWFNHVHEDDRGWVAEAERRAARDRAPFDNVYRFHRKDGREIWVRDRAEVGAVFEDGDVMVHGILTDITAEKQAEEELLHRATHDDLTGLLNRRFLEESIAEHAVRHSERGALIVIDIDQLKFVNDSLGHEQGDAVLRRVAGALATAVADGEVLARLSGDEFAVFMPTASESDAVGRAGSLLRSIRAACTSPRITASAGVAAVGGETSIDPGDLLISADMALYEAKGRGGDHVAAFTRGNADRLAWVERIGEILDGGGLKLSAQPIVELDSDEPVGAELLARLEEGGRTLYPSSWLAPAEAFGLIQRVDRLVVVRAIELVATGRRVSVNLSGRSVGDTELTSLIESELARTGADPSDLVFEITETMTASGTEVLRDFGERIERLGCGLAIDDFGTGFGSFNYLRHLRPRYLKIDREFVQGATRSPADFRLVRSIALIATRLGMDAIAEGIEDSETAKLMWQAGVRLGQGFHFGRPEPLEPA